MTVEVSLKRLSNCATINDYSHFRAIASNQFFKTFPQNYDICKFIETDEVTTSEDKPIISVEIGDCITIFGIKRDDTGKIIGIAGYHVAAGTELEEMSKMLGCFAHEGTTDIFLIGGTESSINDGLVETICNGLNQVLGEKHKVVEEKLNLPGKEYISASLQMDGTLTFCRHERFK